MTGAGDTLENVELQGPDENPYRALEHGTQLPEGTAQVATGRSANYL